MQHSFFSRITSVLLIVSILLLGFGIVQEMNSTLSIQAVPSQPQLTLRFTCALADRHELGILCIQTQPGALVEITVSYCDGDVVGEVNLASDLHGKLQWIWPLESDCRGYAAVMAVNFEIKLLISWQLSC